MKKSRIKTTAWTAVRLARPTCPTCFLLIGTAACTVLGAVFADHDAMRATVTTGMTAAGAVAWAITAANLTALTFTCTNMVAHRHETQTRADHDVPHDRSPATLGRMLMSPEQMFFVEPTAGLALAAMMGLASGTTEAAALYAAALAMTTAVWGGRHRVRRAASGECRIADVKTVADDAARRTAITAGPVTDSGTEVIRLTTKESKRVAVVTLPARWCGAPTRKLRSYTKNLANTYGVPYTTNEEATTLVIDGAAYQIFVETLLTPGAILSDGYNTYQLELNENALKAVREFTNRPGPSRAA